MKKNSKINILEGPIAINLLRLSLPIIFTSLVSILYNLVDSKFIAIYLGDEALVAAAAASFFINFGFFLSNIPKLGAQVLVAQSIGGKKITSARKYARISLIVTLIVATIYTLVNIVFPKELIELLKVTDVNKLKMASDYLVVTAIGYIPLYLIITMSAIINGDGDTFGPFIINSFGLLTNALLDWILLGNYHMGITGAAWATSTSQIITLIIMYFYMTRKKSRFKKLKFLHADKIEDYKKLIKLGLPSGINSFLFSIFSLFLAGLISTINVNALGIQRLGIQFEAFSWNISFGLASAVATFVGQNYGAKNYDRIAKTYKIVLSNILILGGIITIIFVFFPRPLYGMFFKDEKMIALGISYLSIVGFSQLFMCAEITTSGAFNGMGKTLQPTVISIIFTSLRIPIALILIPLLGLNGIWWSISLTSIAKGILVVILFLIVLKKIDVKETK